MNDVALKRPSLETIRVFGHRLYGSFEQENDNARCSIKRRGRDAKKRSLLLAGCLSVEATPLVIQPKILAAA